MALAAGGCAGPAPLRDHWTQTYDPERLGASREQIAKNFNLHRGRWWSYYSRGCWYLELGHAEAAAADLRQAVELRHADKRDARSYGMHFWDYFPHRELGVALFQTGRLAESVDELRSSLVSEDSARAKFYLNKARAALLRQSGADNEPPVIRIETPGGRILSNRLAVPLRGTVTDDQFVASVSITGRDLFIELAQPRIDFEEEIRLKPGAGTVEVRAADLVGRTASAQVPVIIDVVPPVLCVHAIAPGRAPGDPVTADLTTLDDFALDEIRVGTIRVPCDGAKEKVLRGLEARPDAGGLRVTVTDQAGNVTTAVLAVPARSPAPALRDGLPVRFARLAALGPEGGWAPGPARGRPRVIPISHDLGLFGQDRPFPAAFFEAADTSGGIVAVGETPQHDTMPPRVRLNNLPSGEGDVTTTTADAIFVDGWVEDPTGIASIAVNGESEMLAKDKSILVAFNHWVPLEPGLNTVIVTATDLADNTARLALRVERRQPEPFTPAARYAVALLPLEELGPQKGKATDVYEKIIQALDSPPKRFSLIERRREVIERILTEHELVALADKRTAISVGRIISAEGILYGTIAEGASDVTIYLTLTDTETGKVLYGTDVYDKSKDSPTLSRLADGLVSKLKRAFPMVTGRVEGIEEATLLLAVGRRQGLQTDMRLLLYREEQVAGQPLLRPLKLPDGRPIEARVTDAGENASAAVLRNAEAAAIIKAGDKVVTK